MGAAQDGAKASDAGVAQMSAEPERADGSGETPMGDVIDLKLGLKPRLESEKRLRQLMRAVYIQGCYGDPINYEFPLDFVRGYAPISELRPLSPDDDGNGSSLYTVSDCSSGGRLYIFYYPGVKVNYFAADCFFIKKQLHFEDFDKLKKGVSTLDDVKGIDPATQFNFFGYDEWTNFYAGYLRYYTDRDDEHGYFSGHVTKEGIVGVRYQKKGGEFVVCGIDRNKSPIRVINSIKEDDWP
jgi:hypothetical protein